ncbi:hypothetical protein GCM10011613_14030 [Cellvibrio zantedeschiae]|uniref:Uncharacterized protein n=1 Tax=Cellvibrio zantedeschiae TaxID=1237077 RepID=A0ABQ3B1Q2_9GAMM|nr:hypothetical protein [Cellvibrio zantedeschiae]GGY70723.1 hypothetical protein GCM10011613_14030 [Cellvibrio zantedeschiae]
MSSSFYEILELSSGEIVLKRSGDESSVEPLVTLKFSAESIAFLGAARFEVAKAMIEAGMEAASELAEQSHDDITADLNDIEHHILH